MTNTMEERFKETFYDDNIFGRCIRRTNHIFHGPAMTVHMLEFIQSELDLQKKDICVNLESVANDYERAGLLDKSFAIAYAIEVINSLK